MISDLSVQLNAVIRELDDLPFGQPERARALIARRNELQAQMDAQMAEVRRAHAAASGLPTPNARPLGGVSGQPHAPELPRHLWNI